MSCSSYWSYNSFEDVSKLLFENSSDVFEIIEILPIGYSSWSDSVYINVRYRFNDSVIMSLKDDLIQNPDEIKRNVVGIIHHYFSSFLNTNISVEKLEYFENDHVTVLSF